MKMNIFWDVAQFCLVEISPRFPVSVISLIALMMELVNISETSTNLYKTGLRMF
jgi:hypothetical protein